MSFDLLGDLTAKDAVSTRLVFPKDELVEFVGKDTRVDEFKGHLFIKTTVLSGEHAGKEYDIMIAGGDHTVSRKLRAQFYFKSGLWTEEELMSKQFKLSRLVGRKLQGKASKVTKGDNGDFQSIHDIKDLGPMEATTEMASGGF